ncbi:MAG: Na+:solute symporter [Phycisphaerales bacterium]|nr:Na+:solute symporter [Phycisphaerales bacterium]
MNGAAPAAIPEAALGTGLHAIDIAVIVAYFALVIGIMLVFTRRASRGGTQFFLAGRSLPWWVAGTSMVATTFSSDTPLQVTGIVRKGGVSENWWWWSQATGHLISAFVFAKLWRRLATTTDVEFIAVRYSGRAARVLRVIDGVYRGLLINGCVVAAVTLGMGKILAVVLHLPAGHVTSFGTLDVNTTTLIVAGIALATILLSTLSGLYGVAWSDLPQFVLATAGATALAVMVLIELGGPSGLRDAVVRHAGEGHLDMFPHVGWGDAAAFTAMTWFLMEWWARVPGHGGIAQRMLSTRTEGESRKAMLWFCLAHYCVRPWPWIVVALASLALVPTVGEQESAYAAMIDRHLPVGLKGVMLVSLIAAFMSTIDTHVNLAASYLANDVYRPLVRTPPSERRLVWVGRLAAVPLLMLVVLVASGIGEIEQVYKYLAVIMGGAAPILILRWFWWRVNAWAEIAALSTAVVVGNLVVLVPGLGPTTGEVDTMLGVRFAIAVAVTTTVWLTVAFLARPTDPVVLESFYRRARPGGPGWKPVARRCPEVRPDPVGRDLVQAGLGILVVMPVIVGIGWMWLGRPGAGSAALGLAVVAGAVLWSTMRRAADTG